MKKYHKYNIMFCNQDLLYALETSKAVPVLEEEYVYLTDEEFERLCVMMNSEDIDTRHLAFEIFKQKVKEG